MLEITRLKKTGGSLTKKIHLDADGKLANDSSNCRMAQGTAFRQPLPDLRSFAKLIETMPPDTAIALGALRPDLPDRVTIVTKADRRAGRQGFMTRTADDIIYIERRPALALLVFDTKGMPPDVADRIEKAGGFHAALATVCPELAGAGYVRRASTSAGVRNAATGETYSARGQHLFVLAADGRDVRRFLYALHDRCWLAGLSWYIVGKAGQL